MRGVGIHATLARSAALRLLDNVRSKIEAVVSIRLRFMVAAQARN